MKYINLFCGKWENFYSRHDFVIKAVAILFISLCIFGYGYIQIGDSFAYRDMFVSSSDGKLTENLKTGDILEQEFIVSDKEMRGIAVSFATYESVVTEGNAEIRILNEQEESVFETEISASEIEDNEFLNIDFRDKCSLSEGKYLLQMKFTGIENQSIACWLSGENAYEGTVLKINGNEQSAVLVMREIVKGRDMFYYMYLIFMILFFVIIMVSFYMIYRRKCEIWKIYLPVGIFLGILYMMIIPVYAVPDEPSHVYSAYAVSNQLLGVENSEDGTIVMRKDDSESGFAHVGIDRHYYNNYFVKLTNFFVDNEELVQTSNKPVQTHSYLYFFCGLGITLGRLLHLAPIVTFLLGRLFNLTIFLIAVTYALKKIPFGKSVLFVWALLPITLQQTSSFSYDAIVFALSIVIIGLSLRISYDRTEEIKKSEWIILLICVMFLLPTKSYALLPVCLLPFLIYLRKHREGKKILYYTLALAGAMVLSVAVLQVVSMLTSTGSSYGKQGNIIAWANEPGYSVGYLLRHPKVLFVLLCNTIYYKGEFYFETFLGNSLGWFEINIPLFTVIPYFIMLLIAGMRKKEEPLYLSKRVKTGMVLLALMGIGFACAGMLLSWTPVSYRWIEGVQGRYFLPFAVLLFLAVRSDKITVDESTDQKILFSAIWLQLLVFLFICLRAL